MNIKVFIISAVCSFSSLTFGEGSEDSALYAGYGYGSTQYDGVHSIKEKDKSATAFAGYQLSQFLAIQSDFVNLGRYRGVNSDLIEIDLGVVSITAVGMYPIGMSGFGLFGRLGPGVLRYTEKYITNGEEREHSSTGSSINSALGVSYTSLDFQAMSVFISYENYYFMTKLVYGDNDDEESNSIGILGVGARYIF